jgi:hypothetical protein
LREHLLAELARGSTSNQGSLTILILDRLAFPIDCLAFPNRLDGFVAVGWAKGLTNQ